ncbi:MAG: hypothetical protein ACFFE8_05530 [Candidatus Heimdallarchaeota archaeon]
MSNIEELVQKIAQKSGLSRGEILQKIEQKKEDLGFFVNDIAAAYIIAKDMNIELERPELTKKSPLTVKRLKRMEPGLSGVNLTGRVLRIYKPIEFVREGNKNILAPFLFHDGTDQIRTILWGNMARRITGKQVERGSIIKIRQGYTKLGRGGDLELHVGDRGSLDIETAGDLSNLPNPEDEVLNIDVLDEEMDEADIRALVHKIGNLVTFDRKDGSQGRVTNLFLKGDQTVRRMVFWDDRAEEPFNFTRGDELLIQAGSIKLDREGKPEIIATRVTNIAKIGHQALPDLEDRTTTTHVDVHEVVNKKIDRIKSDDGVIAVLVRKGPSDETVRNFSRKDGSSGSVKRAIVFDETGSTTLVLWDEAINAFDQVTDSTIKLTKVRVTVSRYNTLELHTVNDTEFLPQEVSQIPQDPPIQDIDKLDSQQGLASIQGVIQGISEAREFTRTDGSAGRVNSMTIEDATGTCQIVAWGDSVEKLADMKEKNLKYVKIFFGRVRQGNDDKIELHLTPQTHVRPSSRIPALLRQIKIRELEDAQPTRPSVDYEKIQLSELSEQDDSRAIEVFGKLIRIFQQTPYYRACPTCRKKVLETEQDSGWECSSHGSVEPQIIMRISGIVDDGTGTIRVTFFGRSGERLSSISSPQIKTMLEKGLSDEDIFDSVLSEVEGINVLVRGRIRLQAREVQGETIQDQTLMASSVFLPEPQKLAYELIGSLQDETT